MPTAEVNALGDRVVVETRWSEKEVVKAIPGSRWDPDAKVWTVPLSWAACLQLRAGFGSQLEIGPRLTEWSWREFHLRVEPARHLRSLVDRVPEAYDPRLYDFQTAGGEFLVASSRHQDGDPPGGGVLADDLGLGKTAQILAALRRLEQLAQDDPATAYPAAVICPNSVKIGWEKQAQLWNITGVPYVVTGGAVTRRKILERARRDPLALVVVNIESVRLFSRLAPYGSTRLARCRECDKKHGEETLTAARCEVHHKELNGFGLKTVILDEAHRIKDPSAKQTRACWAVGHDPSVLRRWALTGTPIADHIGDLWAILHFLAPHEFPSKSKYIDAYALQAWNPFGGLDIVGINPQRREEFFSIIDSRFRRTPKALVLTQLPKVVRAVRWVEMAPKQAKAYAEMEQRLMTRLDNGALLVSPNNLVNAARLLQLSSSYCEVEWIENPEVRATDKCLCYASGLDIHKADCQNRWKIQVTPTDPSPKLDAMEEAYDELGGKPVVVCAMHRKLIDLATKRFERRKVPYGLITGPVSEYERQRAIQRFRANEVNVVLMTIAAGGTGVDGLQHADTMFCLQRAWSMIENVQVDGRVDRIGSEVHSSVTIVDFVTQNSIESEVQYPRLAAKYERLEELNRDRARLLRAGIAPTQLYELDQLESNIIGGDLTVDAPTTLDLTKITRALAERFNVAGLDAEEGTTR